MASWRALGLGQVERIACTLSGPKGRGWKGIARPGNSSSKGTGTGDRLVVCRGRKSHSG